MRGDGSSTVSFKIFVQERAHHSLSLKFFKQTNKRNELSFEKMSNGNVTNGHQHEVDILIVGFGFACIPLLRLLKERGIDYKIISTGKTIWQRLHGANKLDFDLVTGVNGTYYSEDLIERGKTSDHFPTALEYYEYQEKLQDPFKDQVIDDKVTQIENYFDLDYSLVYTASNGIYKAKNVVFATGLGRPQNDTLINMDCHSIKGKTVILNGAGDSANMILSKLAPNDNKCYLVSDGYVALEKERNMKTPGPENSHRFIPILGFRTGKFVSVELMQHEAHTLGVYFPKFYGYCLSVYCWGPDHHRDSWFDRLFYPDMFFVKYPETKRVARARGTLQHHLKGGASWSNGTTYIKHHAIDMYMNKYGKDLEGSIRKGYMMNDLTFFHTEGLVETLNRSRTSIDRKNKTLFCVDRHGKKRIIRYDTIVEFGDESPNLPPIYVVDEEGRKSEYKYNFRESLYGVVPERLKNVFFMGLVRPTTGGVANLNEIQAIMIHKLLSDERKRDDMYLTIHERIAKYNKFYYWNSDEEICNPKDHLVWFGLYVWEVAEFVGIHRPVFLKSLTSFNPFTVISNIRFEFMSPTNTIKYRMEGEYKLEGAEELVRATHEASDQRAHMFRVYACIFVDRVLGHQCIAMLSWKWANAVASRARSTNDLSDTQAFGAAVLATAPLFLWLFHLFEMNIHYTVPITNCFSPGPIFGLKAHFQPLAMLYILCFGEWYWCFGVLGFWIMLYLPTRHLQRYTFGDCKHKHKFRPFWEEYKKVYLKLNSDKNVEKKTQ